MDTLKLFQYIKEKYEYRLPERYKYEEDWFKEIALDLYILSVLKNKYTKEYEAIRNIILKFNLLGEEK